MPAIHWGALALAATVLRSHAAPDEWQFDPVVLEPNLHIQSVAIGVGGAITFVGEKTNAQGDRLQQGVFLQETPDAPSIPIAIVGEAMPGGLGLLTSVRGARLDPQGRVLFKGRLAGEDHEAVLRWDAGETSRMLPVEPDFEHQLEYLTSDGRWIVEDRHLRPFNPNPILTDGVTPVRLLQGFNFQSSACGHERRRHAVPNAAGEALFLRFRSQDTEFKDENGVVESCSLPNTYTWSLSRAGASPGPIVSGLLETRIGGSTGTHVQDGFEVSDAKYLFNDAGEVLFLRENHLGGLNSASLDLVRASANGSEEVVLASPPFGDGTPLQLLGFDRDGRTAFTTRSGIFAGPQLTTDRILTETDTLFGAGILSLGDQALAGPPTSPTDQRKVVFSYRLVDGRSGHAVATRIPTVDPQADTDGDGLLDTWEAEGRGIDANDDGVIDLDLFALGARPDHKDLFVEIDATPAEPPIRTAALDMVTAAFARAPVTNPDGTTGIRLHLEIDEKDVNSEFGATLANAFPAGFREVTKPAHFGTGAQRAHPNRQHLLAAKRRAFRYCMVYDSIEFPAGVRYLGIGEIGGNDFILHIGEKVFRDGFRDTEDQASTFMHELGHTLGLRHGGGVDEVIVFEPKSWQGKPNYPSIMNYALAHPYRWSARFWQLDFCREALPDMNESSLNERTGIPSTLYRQYAMPYGVGAANRRVMRLARLDGRPIDFNGNRSFNNGVTGDLNFIGAAADFAGVDRPSPEEIMKGHDDWASLQYAVVDKDGDVDGDVPLADGCPTTEIHDLLNTIVPVEAETYAEWIAAYAEEGLGQVTLTGFSDDPDGDGIQNGIERYFGTNPGEAGAGFEVVAGSEPLVFRHPLASTPPAGMTAAYEWSSDLRQWRASGATADGSTVDLVPATLEAPGAWGDVIEVAPVIQGLPLRFLYIRLRIENPAG